MDTENLTCDMSATLRQYPVELIRLEKIAQQMAESARERQP
jgi:hypothetical protein